MNAVPQPKHPSEPQALPAPLRLEPMTDAWLDAVVAIEKAAYTHPWSRGNFTDSLVAGYHARVLLHGAELLGYYVLMKGLDETHLLNITVAPSHQGQGLARLMLDDLTLWSMVQSAQWLWLEVRISNSRARHVYERYGFKEVGVRRNYYPLAAFRREDAVVMSLPLRPEEGDAA